MLAERTGSVTFLRLGCFRIGVLAALTATAPVASAVEYHFHHPDMLGSNAVVVTRAGEVIARTVHDPYGRITSSRDASGGPLSRDAETPRHSFTGQEYDAESDLNYFGARYYDPAVGRFLSTDPGFVRGGGSLRQIASSTIATNGYAYALNRPTTLVDPTGELAILATLVTAAIFLLDPGSAVNRLSDNPSIETAKQVAVDEAIGIATGRVAGLAARAGGGVLSMAARRAGSATRSGGRSVGSGTAREAGFSGGHIGIGRRRTSMGPGDRVGFLRISGATLPGKGSGRVVAKETFERHGIASNQSSDLLGSDNLGFFSRSPSLARRSREAQRGDVVVSVRLRSSRIRGASERGYVVEGDIEPEDIIGFRRLGEPFDSFESGRLEYGFGGEPFVPINR